MRRLVRAAARDLQVTESDLLDAIAMSVPAGIIVLLAFIAWLAWTW